MKRILGVLLSLLLLLSLFSVTAFAAEENDIGEFELPAPKAPNYFVYTDGNASEGHHDDLRMIMVADPEVALLAAEYDRDSEAFYKKYGLYSFNIVMQYDVSLDGEDNWQHNEEWDTEYYNDGHVNGYPVQSLRSELMDDFEFFWLTYYEGPDSDTFVPYKPAILTEKFTGDGYEDDIYSFDVENHNLYIRCRYYMEWETFDAEKNEIGEKQSKFSDWSESAIFGKNSTQITPDEPTTYAAPMISDMKIVLSMGDENSHIEYVQTTPESVWMNGVYYLMKEEGQFDGLETQVSIDGGEWIEFDTADAGDDWCLWNGNRGAYNDDVPIEENSGVKLRIRFTGTHGPSEWSNVLELNGGGTQENPDNTGEPTDEKPPVDEKDKCSLCGFCPVPLGLCIFIWIAIVVVIILVIVIIIVTLTKKKKCPNCKTKCKKNDKCCPNCGQQLK
ncbi:MAG: zinc ribbon domain-containing protein [Ruminococcus sp.]|nr:zinc ribbon domain-containing protein [Ruminococcus sp.]